MEFRRVLFRSAGFIVDQAQQLAQHLKPDMADGAVLAVVAVAPMGKPFQPVIFLGRLHEARDILGLERLPESPDRKSLGSGKGGSVRLSPGGRRILKTKKRQD